MNKPEIFPLRITVLSPVHMGTDEDYIPTNYVIDGKQLYALGMTAATLLPAKGRKELERVVSGKVDEWAVLAIQNLFYSHREVLKAEATHSVHVASGVAELYRARIGRVAQQERGGRRVHNRLEIERAFYNPVDQQPLLPGSGLKGAVRTALLDTINQGRETQGRERNRELQERLFDYTMHGGNLYRDPLRLVHISDAAAIGSVERKIMFAVNRRRKRGEHQSQAEQRGLYQLLECLMPGASFVGEIRIQPPPPKAAPMHRFDLRHVARSCNAFYREIFVRECTALNNRGLLDAQWMQSVNQLLQSVEAEMESGKAFLLRVGRHCGAESVTLNGVRKIKIMQGRGKQPTWEDKPKTWWLGAEAGKDQQKMLLPFGWLLVEEATGDFPKRRIALSDKEVSARPSQGPRLSPAEIAKARMAARQK